MNYIVTLLLPMLAVNFLGRFVQFLINQEARNKVIPVVFICLAEVFVLVGVLLFINKDLLNLFSALFVLHAMLFSTTQAYIDDGTLDVSISRAQSFFIVLGISSITLIGIYAMAFV